MRKGQSHIIYIARESLDYTDEGTQAADDLVSISLHNRNMILHYYLLYKR